MARERWDSLRLLTPNWMSRLPDGYRRTSGHPDGFDHAAEVVGVPRRYAAGVAAPVRPARHGDVGRHRTDDGYRVLDDHGRRSLPQRRAGRRARARPPAYRPPRRRAGQLGRVTISATGLPEPRQRLEDGGVLVVGASATGVQLADELTAIRPAGDAGGRRARPLPRSTAVATVRGGWTRTGVLDERYDEIDDLGRAAQRRRCSSSAPTTAAASTSTRLAGRSASAWSGGSRGGRRRAGMFSGGLANLCALADLKLERLLDRFDASPPSTGGRLATRSAWNPPTMPAAAPARLRARGVPHRRLGDRVPPDCSWLDAPVLDRQAAPARRGCRRRPGCTCSACPFLRRRRSPSSPAPSEDAEAVAGRIVPTSIDGAPPSRRARWRRTCSRYRAPYG